MIKTLLIIFPLILSSLCLGQKDIFVGKTLYYDAEQKGIEGFYPFSSIEFDSIWCFAEFGCDSAIVGMYEVVGEDNNMLSLAGIPGVGVDCRVKEFEGITFLFRFFEDAFYFICSEGSGEIKYKYVVK